LRHGGKKYMTGSPETLDFTSDGIMRKGSIDNEGRRIVSEDVTFQTEVLVCAFQLNELHVLQKGHVTADEFSLSGENLQQAIRII